MLKNLVTLVTSLLTNEVMGVTYKEIVMTLFLMDVQMPELDEVETTK